jgi:stage III sporulation protein SpoIIIAA
MSNNNIIINKPTVSNTTVTRDLRQFDIETENVYESLVIMSKRANQIAANVKGKLAEFASSNDNLEEVFENR